MGEEEDEKPWKKRLRQLKEQQEAALRARAAQQKEPSAAPAEGEPTELQRQLVEWYRNTFLVAGAALVGSVWHWNFGGQSKAVEVFVPPRAASLPTEVVEGWKRSVRFKEGIRTVGRQTLFATGVAALYFGAELGARRWRDADDWVNTAAGGAAAGGYLGSLLPGPSRARSAALGAAVGGALGAASGAAQAALRGMAEASAPGQRQGQQQQQQEWGDWQPDGQHQKQTPQDRGG